MHPRLQFVSASAITERACMWASGGGKRQGVMDRRWVEDLWVKDVNGTDNICTAFLFGVEFVRRVNICPYPSPDI